MEYAYVAGALALALMAAAALWQWRRGRERVGFALLIGAPVCAALVFAGASHLATRTAVVGPADPHAALAPSGADAGDVSAATSALPAGASPADALRHRAEQLRVARRYVEARDAYAELTRLTPQDADAWADLADATAAAAGGDLEQARDALARALELDPQHLKALWLQATLELQRKQYDASAQRWEQLLRLLPAGSNDARIVAANLEEARALARGAR